MLTRCYSSNLLPYNCTAITHTTKFKPMKTAPRVPKSIVLIAALTLAAWIMLAIFYFTN